MISKNKFYLLSFFFTLAFTYSSTFATEVSSSNPIITMKKSSNSKGIGERLETLVKNFTTYAQKEIKEKNDVDVLFDVSFSSFEKVNSSDPKAPKTYFAYTEIIKSRRLDTKYIIPLNLNPADFNTVGFSEDSFALALCHEIGHHHKNIELLRQYNMYPPDTLNEVWADWLTIDYCMNYFRNEKGLKFIKESKISEDVKVYCKQKKLTSGDYNLCVRSSSAALNLVLSMQEKRYQINSTKYQKVSLLKNADLEDVTNIYPEDQCRLDIFKAQITCHLNNEISCEKPACWTQDNNY